jgi:hypothetical protein
MKKTLLISGLLMLALSLALTACNKADSGANTNGVITAPSSKMTAAATPATPASTSPAGTTEAAGAVCAGCGKPESECTCGHEATGKSGEAKEAPAVPSSLALADGKSVPVISVATLNADPKAHSGLVAIDGTIGDVFADKGRFMLVDCGAGHCEDKNCAGCSADQQVPVRYDAAGIKGELPAKAQRVFVVAEVKPTETGGFTLAVQEVRCGEKCVCSFTKQA